MKKIYALLIISTLALCNNSKTQAQNWTVGVPVDMSISYLTKYAFACAPNQADFTMNIILNSVGGIQYMAIVDSVQDIAILFNTTDTLNQGDTLYLTQGNNNYSVSFVNGTGNISFNFKAVGTPTTAGQNHPCAFNDLWMSNLMLCNEGLTRNVQNTCTVDAATGIENLVAENDIVFPNASNNYMLSLNSSNKFDKVGIFDISGKLVISEERHSNKNVALNCQGLNSGIYFVSITQNNQTATYKFVINN